MTDSAVLGLVGSAAVKAAVILAIAGLVSIAWRSASAASRHLVWTLGVSAALAIPAIGAAISRFNAPHIEMRVWNDVVNPPMFAPTAPISGSSDPAVADASPNSSEAARGDILKATDHFGE